MSALRALAEKFVIVLGIGTVFALFIIFLPKFNSSLADSLGAGVATFLNGVWIALTVIFWLAIAIVGAVAFVKIRQMMRTHIIYDPKDNRPVRAVIHKGQLVQIAPAGMDITEIMQIQAQQMLQMKQNWQMLTAATTSMNKMAQFMDELDVVDADEDEDDMPQVQATFRPALPEARGVPYEQERLLVNALEAFQIHARVLSEVTAVGPRIIQFGVVPTGTPVILEDGSPKRDNTGQIIYSKHTRIEEITKREKDIQLALGAKSIRILSPVPGKRYVGIEIPNPTPTTVTIADVLESSEYQQACATSKLVVALGRDVNGRVRFCDIEKAPHILIGGSTNAGKSVLVNVIIASLLSNATPDDVRMIMIDPKMVELTPYNGIAHLLRPVITDMTKVVPMLKHAINEMERRYQIFAGLGVRKLSEYREMRVNRPELENLPAWVIIFDEFADLMMTAPAETEDKVIRLAQMARATGIHLVIATQKPVVEVVTSLIKGNLPTAIALKTKTASDSRVILDQGGAERLLGNGDMLYLAADSEEPIRIQGAYMTNDQIQSAIALWKTSNDFTVSQTPYTDELNGNAETAGNGSGNSLETATEANAKIIDGVFPDTAKVTEELTENSPASAVSSEKRETIKRLVAMKKRPAHRDIAKAVGLGGRNYHIYQQVCKEEGIIINQAEEA